MSAKKTYQALPSPVVTVERPKRSAVRPPRAPLFAPEVHYPSEDGRPIAENSWHARAMTDLYGILRARYRRDSETFVGIDLLVYYTQDQPSDSVAPDVFVAFGVKNEDRLWYKVWEQRKAPDFVVEMASNSSSRADLGRKKDLYQRLGVREYCVYDPRGGLLWPRLQLFELVQGVYEQVTGCTDAGGPLALPSAVLGLELRFEDDRLRLWDPEARQYLLDLDEEHAARLAAERRAQAEALARRELEAQLAELRAQRREPH